MTGNAGVRISYNENGHKGHFAASVEGADGEGELTISAASEVLIIADPTFVPDTLLGARGGSGLVEAPIADACARVYRIAPLPPFVRAKSQKHPEWSDVIQP